jgi:hypothetical protein
MFDPAMCLHLDGQFRTVIGRLGLRAGNMNFDALAVKGTVYIVDVGLRCGGNFVPDLIQLSTGFDMSEAAVYAAFGEHYPTPALYAENPAPAASYLMGSRFGGRFEGFEFDPAIAPYVVETRPFLENGQNVRPYTRSDYAVGITFFRFPDPASMNARMDDVEELVKLRVLPVRGQKDKSRPSRGTEVTVVEDGSFKEFPELISPFLRQKMNEAEAKNDQIRPCCACWGGSTWKPPMSAASSPTRASSTTRPARW